MARGFSTSLGSSGTDVIETQLTTIPRPTRTYAFWVLRNGTGGGASGRMVSKERGVDNEEEIDFNSTTYRFLSNRVGLAGLWTFTSPATGAFNHVAVTYDDSSTNNDPVMYLNGVSQAITEVLSPTGANIVSTVPFAIGNKSTGSRVWDGTLAEVGVWNRILTLAEVQGLADRYSPLFWGDGLTEYVTMVRDNVSYKLGAPTITGTAVQPHPAIIYPERPTVTTAFATRRLSLLPLLGVGV